MNRNLCILAFVLGVLAVGWVGAGYLHSNPLALVMTLVIGVVYGMGALEMFRFRQATVSLATALEAIPPNLGTLGDWLRTLHPDLQNAVRLRVEGERTGLPGPALTPYLVGLLVMLGMLGTFLGMVVTLNGAVFALEGTTDLQTMRSSLAAPIKGLGLAFGTSVAGVATSALLGLISSLCRRERLLVSQRLDARIATDLRAFSVVHQRQEAFIALQRQAQALPAVMEGLQAIMATMERQNQQLYERLAASQESFHRDVRGVYADLATSVDQSLRASLTESARAAGDAVRPMVEVTMQGIARESASLHAAVTEAAAKQLDGIAARFGQTAAEVIGQLRREISVGVARDNELLDERTRLLEELNAMLDSLNQGAAGQRAAIETLVNASTTLLDRFGGQLVERIEGETNRMAEMATQVASSAVEVASLGEAFGLAVGQFGEVNEKMIANLARIETSLDKSMSRSDEQLAYYVAQAREIIDLSILSQKRIIDDMQRLAAKQARPVAEVMG